MSFGNAAWSGPSLTGRCHSCSHYSTALCSLLSTSCVKQWHMYTVKYYNIARLFTKRRIHCVSENKKTFAEVPAPWGPEISLREQGCYQLEHGRFNPTDPHSWLEDLRCGWDDEWRCSERPVSNYARSSASRGWWRCSDGAWTWTTAAGTSTLATAACAALSSASTHSSCRLTQFHWPDGQRGEAENLLASGCATEAANLPHFFLTLTLSK